MRGVRPTKAKKKKKKKEFCLLQEFGHKYTGPGARALREGPWRVSLSWKESDEANQALPQTEHGGGALKAPEQWGPQNRGDQKAAHRTQGPSLHLWNVGNFGRDTPTPSPQTGCKRRNQSLLYIRVMVPTKDPL